MFRRRPDDFDADVREKLLLSIFKVSQGEENAHDRMEVKGEDKTHTQHDVL